VGIDGHFRRQVFKTPDGSYGVSSNTDVALVPRIARPIHDMGVLNQDVEGLDLKKEA